MPGEAHARRGEIVEGGTRLAIVSVGAEPIGAQGGDQDEEDVRVVPESQAVDVGGLAFRSQIARRDLDQRGEVGDERQPPHENEGPYPARAFFHGRAG